MAISFNVIAFMLPFLRAAELEVAGVIFARVVRNALQCRTCGARYGLIVPTAAAPGDVAMAMEELRERICSTCGHHPPLIQNQ